MLTADDQSPRRAAFVYQDGTVEYIWVRKDAPATYLKALRPDAVRIDFPEATP